MKKITLFLAFIGMITLQSCSVNENQNVTDNDTISEVWEFNNNVNFVASNNYDVTLNGETYTLDTCTTALTSDSIVNTTLDKLWNYFETAE